MNINDFRYLITLSEELNFGKAASLCGISQPSLSTAIRKMERELGVELFERRPQSISLTSAGKAVVRQTEKILREIDELKDIAHQQNDPLSGPLKLGAIYTVSPYLMPGLVRRMTKLAPAMPLILTENYTTELLEELKNGDIDIAITALPIYAHGLSFVPLYDEDLVVAVPHNHPWKNHSCIEHQDLASDHLLLLGNGRCLRNQVLNICPDSARAYQSLIQRTVSGSSLTTIRHMVAQGLGITVLPASAVGQTGGDHLVKTVPFAEPIPTRRIIAVWRKSFTRFRTIEILKNAVSDLSLPGCHFLNLPSVNTP